MKRETKTATAEKAYGKTLPAPGIKYEFTFDTYENGEELIKNNDQLTIAEQVKVRNTEALSKARQAALTAALLANGIVAPTEENDDDMRLKNLFTTLMSSKIYSEPVARAMASKALKLQWPAGTEVATPEELAAALA